MLTGDLNIVEVEWTILYRITDVKKWLFAVDNKRKTIEDISMSVVSELVGDRTISEVIGAGRSAIQDQAAVLMNQLFDKYNLGITITQVQMQNVNPPVGAVQAAFQDVNKATQDMERLINEGKERYNTEIPKARGAAQQIIQQAEGYAAERVNKAEGDVARFNSVFTQYRQDPRDTRVRLYNEMIEDVFGGVDDRSVLLDKSLRNAVPLLNLFNSSTRQQAAGAGVTQ
jgi:modulator of FtsH protease HflK